MSSSISIKTNIPGPKSLEMAKERSKYVLKPMGESLSPCFIAKGEGAIVTDVDGNSFIDLTGGWGCLIAGHSHPRIVEAVKKQVEKFTHTDFTAVPYDSFVGLCKKLAEIGPGESEKTVGLFNSGAEAIENAVKIARAYTGRPAIVVFENAFHGRTLLTMTMTHKAIPYKYKFGPLSSEVYRLPFLDTYHPSINIKDFENIMRNAVNPETVAAIVVEPIQGEGGFNIPASGFLELIRELCNKNGIMMITDEIQSGVGRTGKFFAIEHWSIEPDIICLAKALASGLPLSAVITKKEISNSLLTGSIGGTYVGNPLSCKAALEVIKIIEEENLLERAIEIGEKLKNGFKDMMNKYNLIGDVRGVGAMVAIELVKDRATKEPAPEETFKIIDYCVHHGVFVPSAGINRNVLRMLLSLVITNEQLQQALDVIDNAIANVVKNR